MGLIEAITHEMEGDLPEAVSEYESTSEIGSKLDKAGIWDALARVHTKMGHLTQAGQWHAQSARAFLDLPKDAMDRDEAMYQALTRFRQAFADWHEDPQYRPGVMKEWGMAFEHCWEAFPEGITHEALFYARALVETDEPERAAEVFRGVAEIIEEDATEEEAQVVRDVWRAASDAYRDAGRNDAADEALGKFEEHGGELPDEDEGEEST